MSQPEQNLWGGSQDDLGDAADILGAGLDIEEPREQTPDIPDQPDEGVSEPEETPEEEVPEEEPEPLEEEGTADETPEEETAEEQAERLYANKYRTPEELERGYQNQSRLVTEHAARAAATQRQLDELQAAVQQYVAQQPQQAPQAPQAAAMPDPTDAELAEMNIDRAGWNALKPLMQRGVQAAVQPYIEQIQTQSQAQQQLTQEQFYAQQQEAETRRLTEAATATVQAFYGDHPEFDPSTPEGMEANQQIANLIEGWNMAWTGDPSGLAEGAFDPGDKDSLEIAAEALDRPMLAQILATNPRYFDTEAGMTLARKQADLYEAAERASTQGRKPKKALPAVEEGSSGSGARELETRPRDAIDDIVEYTKQEKAKSVFSQ